MNALPTIAFALILASAALQALFLLRPSRREDRASSRLLLAAAASLLAWSVGRSLEIGFPALTGTFESLAFYALALCLVCFAYRVQRALPFLPPVQFGATIVAASLLAIASSPIAPKQALPPIPALRSGWLALHVAFSFVGEAFFALSFAAALGCLAAKDESRRLAYDRLTYGAIAVGYPIFTAGALVFGAIWAQRAWGTWWSWDPKETWALVTWLVYTFYLHLRFVRRRGDRLAAIVAVVGFLCTVFTFFGVNYLLPGLHSY
ncbi:MAG TPA: cytochrome c biogenesis protein CcsA [Spirochaetales bacterium]|nr:cytochrome c biogenesis protein CcsA [Spirochaetales bacterium]HRY53638.1 cytochrome c biogenesis protein CcsA [Spirochaetia bacterium]HRZ63731.1 cytochrome c biogenesis protein CcsA [Spirochaetia bacterium]